MNEITVFEKFEADLVKFEAVDKETKFDVTTSEGYAECKAYHVKLRKVYNGTDKIRKKTNEDAQQAIKDTNTEAKLILTRIDAMANPRKSMMDAEDAKVQKKIDDLVEANRLIAEQEEADRVAEIERQQKELADAQAKLAADQKAIQDEKDAIEREKQAEADKLAAVEEAKRQAEQDAKDAAAQVERDKQAALAKAEQDKLDAIEAEKEKARKAEMKRIADGLAIKHEKERIAGLEKALKENEEHREEIESDIMHDINMVITPVEEFDSLAKTILDAIITGKISHLTINY